MLTMWRLCLVTGGVREALFGDENYPIMWGKRQGFAKAAIQANVVRHYIGTVYHFWNSVCFMVFGPHSVIVT